MTGHIVTHNVVVVVLFVEDKIMKRSSLKKKSKQKISIIQRKLWELCKKIIRKKYPNECYTCRAKSLSGSNWQTGHMWSKASLGASLKYDLRVLRPQCMTCNLWQGGRGADFYSRMLEEIGWQQMGWLERDRRVTVPSAYDHYVNLIDEYSKILETL